MIFVGMEAENVVVADVTTNAVHSFGEIVATDRRDTARLLRARCCYSTTLNGTSRTTSSPAPFTTSRNVKSPSGSASSGSCAE